MYWSYSLMQDTCAVMSMMTMVTLRSMITMVTIIPNAGHLNLYQGHNEDAQEDAQDVAEDVHQHYGDQGHLEIGYHQHYQRCRKQGTHVSFAKEDTSLYIVQLLESFQYQMDDARLYLT